MRWSWIVLAAIAGAGCKERPVECQRLRQCCAAVAATGAEVEDVRVACTRKDDDDATLCRRRLEQVQTLVPAAATEEACRLPAAP